MIKFVHNPTSSVGASTETKYKPNWYWLLSVGKGFYSRMRWQIFPRRWKLSDDSLAIKAQTPVQFHVSVIRQLVQSSLSLFWNPKRTGVSRGTQRTRSDVASMWSRVDKAAQFLRLHHSTWKKRYIYFLELFKTNALLPRVVKHECVWWSFKTKMFTYHPFLFYTITVTWWRTKKKLSKIWINMWESCNVSQKEKY